MQHDATLMDRMDSGLGYFRSAQASPNATDQGKIQMPVIQGYRAQYNSVERADSGILMVSTFLPQPYICASMHY